MPSRKEQFEILLVLFVQTAIWTLSTTLPEKTAQLSPYTWDDGDFWFRRSTTRKPYVWERSTTRKPYIWERSTTRKPYVWERSTSRKPYIWERSTSRKPYDWDRYTTRDYSKRDTVSTATDPVLWLILGGGLFVGLIVMLIKYACDREGSSTNESSAILHPPPARIILPPNRATHNSGIRTGSQNTTDSNIPSERAMHHVSSAGDKPPGYSEVLFFDFTKENTKFPNVSPKPLETPPPNYQNDNLPRF